MKLAGRPKKAITLEELEKLCALHCTNEEIAAFFNVSVSTIERRMREATFSQIVESGRAKGRISLRREQFNLAQKGDRVMLIWLGKQYLGQTDVMMSASFSGPVDMNDARAKLDALLSRRAESRTTPEVPNEPE